MQGSSSPPHGTWGGFALLMPVGWNLDSVFCSGSGYALEMVPDDWCSELLSWHFGQPPPWLKWEGFCTDQEVLVEEGDVWTGTVHISTDGLVGSVELVALTATNGYGGITWSGDPCTTTVEVIELQLSPATWGEMKVELGSER